MREFLKHIMLEVKRVLPGLNLMDPRLAIQLTASVPENASRNTIARFTALLEEAWSKYGTKPVAAKVTVVITREPFAAALAVQERYYQFAPVPGSTEVGGT